MLAIATLVEDDPYLKLPRSERIAATRARRAKIASLTPPPRIAHSPPPKLEPIEETRSEINVPKEYFQRWLERQEIINPLPKPIWFSIAAEIDPAEPRRPRIEKIQSVVARHFRVTRDEIISPRRIQRLIVPRHVAMYLCRQLTIKSHPEIGRHFGDRDHTTSLAACVKIEGLIRTDATIASAIKTLTSEIMGVL